MQQYKKEIKALYKPISKEDQTEIYKAIRNGDLRERENLIHSCLPLVYEIALNFSLNNKYVELDDLIQNGNLALVKAVDAWDIRKSLITTIVTHYVKNELINMVAVCHYKINNLVSVCKNITKDYGKIKHALSISSDQGEIQKITGFSAKKINRVMSVGKGYRVNFSGVKEHEISSYYIHDTNTNGCLADLISLLDDNSIPVIDRKIFLSWLGVANKNGMARRVAREVNSTKEEVWTSVKTTKRTLKRLARA